MSQNAKEFQNENLSVLFTEKPGCVCILEITAKPALAEEMYSRALKNIRKEVSLPGFRKGKAPDKVILTKFAPQIEREFRELFLNESARQAIQLCETYPWNRSESLKAEINEASLEKGGKFKVEFESFPKVPEISPDALQVKDEPSEKITDEAVEKHLDSLRYHHAKWNDVEGRAIKNDDFVEATMEVLAEDGAQKFPPRKSNFHVNKDHLEEWMYDFLIGKEAGSTAELTPPKPKRDKESDEPEIEIPKRKFKVTIEKIRSAELEEMNDEFAKKFGAESMEDLKAKVRKYLEDKEKDRVRGIIHGRIQSSLLKKYPFEVPSSLFENERQTHLKRLIQSYKEMQYSEEEIKKSREKLEEVAKQRADNSLRTHFLLTHLASAQKFEISREEVLQELIQESLEQQGTVNSELISNPDKYTPMIKEKLQLVKAMDYLAERVSRT